MSDCCDTETCESHTRTKVYPCPTNQRLGKKVDTLTVKALLAISLDNIRPAEYLFCHEPDCPTVYYSADGIQVFSESDLRERVHQKHPDDNETLVCYCFQHTRGSIRAEILAAGKSTVIEQINSGIQAGVCACDIRNPQGTCCLGNIRAIVKQIESSP